VQSTHISRRSFALTLAALPVGLVIAAEKSAAPSAKTAAAAKPTAISTELGGSFTLFGGYITGRHLEMLPNELYGVSRQDKIEQ